MGGVRAEVAKLVLGYIEHAHATLGLVANFSLCASNRTARTRHQLTVAGACALQSIAKIDCRH